MQTESKAPRFREPYEEIGSTKNLWRRVALSRLISVMTLSLPANRAVRGGHKPTLMDYAVGNYQRPPVAVS